MRKLIIALIMVMALMSMSFVSADENLTDSLDNFSVADDSLIDNYHVYNGTPKQNTSISTSEVVGYETFTTDIIVSLNAGNESLGSRSIGIVLNNVTYERVTNATGQASLSVKLAKGFYNFTFSYAGDENTTSCSGTGNVTIESPKKTTITVADKYINYRQGLKNVFIVRVLDEDGKAVKNQSVNFIVNGKRYSAKTDSKGYAEIYLNLKKGTYTVKFSFYRTSPYLYSKGSYKIKVKGPISNGNGYWLWANHMYKVNLKKLSGLGTKHIFLHANSLSVYGKSAVVSWIKKAHNYGIKVHLWMQVCYSGGKWVRPVNNDGSINYVFLNKKVAEAKKYSKIKGVDGVLLDYVRFGGTAHLYNTSTKAINYFVKKVSVGIHDSKPNCIVSATVMPEPEMLSYWYGQDISTMGKYLDVIIPMVYKGNFNEKTPWITKIVQTYKKQSKSAVIWAGLQAYHSDSNIKKLSLAELLKDARAAKAGGATGSILFRIGNTNYLNFKKV